LALALAAWLWTSTRDLSARGRGLGTIAAVLTLLAGLYGVAMLGSAGTTPPAKIASANAEPFTPERLASLRASGKPVFVDATAAWCITCLVNEDAVLSRPSVKSAFTGKNVAYLVADWTNQNPEITQLLKDNGRSGVPLYLYYAPHASTPVILPQILTESGVLGALGG
jgi:thiol:disulfide interchange protein DsbD